MLSLFPFQKITLYRNCRRGNIYGRQWYGNSYIGWDGMGMGPKNHREFGASHILSIPLPKLPISTLPSHLPPIPIVDTASPIPVCHILSTRSPSGSPIRNKYAYLFQDPYSARNLCSPPKIQKYQSNRHQTPETVKPFLFSDD